MQNTPSPDTNEGPDFFNMSAADLLDWEQFYNEDDQALPTDLMVAMINHGLIIRD